jgi:hypothetical protein
MLLTLLQNAQMLRQNRRALDSTITPSLDLLFNSGVLWATNTGTVDIANIEIAAIYIKGPFEHRGRLVAEPQLETLSKPLIRLLRTGEKKRYALVDSVEAEQERFYRGRKYVDEERSYCVVIRYRRAVDMHPFHKAVSFARLPFGDSPGKYGYLPLRAMPGVIGEAKSIVGDRKAVEQPCLDALDLKSFDP